MSNIRFNVKDNSNENSTFKIAVDDAISDANITALRDAIDGVSIGTVGQTYLDLSVAKDAGSQALPASPFAQRETKWLASYTDDVTGEAYKKEVPCADLSLIVAGTQAMNIAAGAGLTFKTQWDALVKSRDGNATTLQGAIHVGRNL